MRISVIVTTYNRPDALEAVLAGLADQREPPAEVIVADDGSGPETARRVAAAARRAAFALHHVWQPDEGFRAAAARNAAVRRSRGDYFVFLDGDCIPARRFVADHRRLAEAGCFFQGSRVLVSRRRTPGFDARRTRRPLALLADLAAGHLGNPQHLLRLPAWPAGRSRRLAGIRSCNFGVARDDLYAVNGFDEAYVGWGREDSDLAVRLMRYGLRCKRHPFMAVCFHLWHPENDRGRLAANDERLRRRMAAGGRVCAEGLVQDGEQP